MNNLSNFNPETVEQWLIEWARWAKTHKSTPGGRCKSLENRYKSPQCWHPEPAIYSIDILQAEKIEDIWVRLPDKPKKLLKMRYILKAGELFIQRRLRIREIEQEIDSAKYMVWNRYVSR